MAKARRLLPDDAAPGEEAALKYFLRHDRETAAAWWFFCLWCTDHKPAFSRQLEQLAARMGRPVTHVDGIRVALRFWDLAMSSDPAFADQWRADRERVPEPKLEDWGELGRLIEELARQEWQHTLEQENTETEEDKIRGELWAKAVERKTGQTFEAHLAEMGLTADDAGIFALCKRIERDARDIAHGLAMWAAAPQGSKIMALADRVLLKGPAS